MTSSNMTTLPATTYNPYNYHFPSSIDSTPSLNYSDLTDDSEVPTEMPLQLSPMRRSPNRNEDTIVGAMSSVSLDGLDNYIDASIEVQQVLVKLDSVVSLLRTKGELEAANTIAKLTLEIVATFNNTTAPWDLQSFRMPPPSTKPSTGLANAGTASQPRPAVATAGSWASVAAKAVKTSGKNHIIKYQPSDAVVKRYEEPKASPEDMRVIWIQGWQRGRPLGQISEYVTQGPICSMAYAEEYGAVCIVFQYAESARDLFESCSMYEEDEGVCLFGTGCALQLGQPYPMTDDLKRMDGPIHERRRLTFARSQMFAHGMTESKFRNEIYELVGEANVELVWLFNSGNATVVFTSTSIARIVREAFLRRSKQRGPYENVQVTYSHDPCEKPMNLITQMGVQPKRPRSDSTRSGNTTFNGNGLHRSNTRNSGGGDRNGAAAPITRRQSKRGNAPKDIDGWQTVTHKK